MKYQILRTLSTVLIFYIAALVCVAEEQFSLNQSPANQSSAAQKNTLPKNSPTKSEAKPNSRLGVLIIQPAILSLIDQSEIAARDAGQLTEIKVKDGERVTTGQNLTNLDDREAKAALAKATADYEMAKKQAQSDVKLRYARATLEVSEAEYKRAKEAQEKFQKSISQTEMEQLRLVAEKNKLEIEQTQEEIQIAQLNAHVKQQEIEIIKARLDKRYITAPFEGTIVQTKKHLGEWVQPGDVVFRLIRTDRLRIEGFVPVKKLTSDVLESEAKISLEIPGQGLQNFIANVTYISPEVNAVNGQVRIRAEIDNTDGKLRAGMSGKMEIMTLKAEDETK